VHLGWALLHASGTVSHVFADLSSCSNEQLVSDAHELKANSSSDWAIVGT
jgi:hypothetical protein